MRPHWTTRVQIILATGFAAVAFSAVLDGDWKSAIGMAVVMALLWGGDVWRWAKARGWFVVLAAALMMATASANEMPDAQWQALQNAQAACFHHERYDAKSGAWRRPDGPGWSRCPEIEQLWRPEADRRRHAAERDDEQEILIYFSMYPSGGKLGLDHQ